MSQFSVESFSSHITKHFVEEPFCAVFQKNSGGEKNYGKEGGKGEYRIFRQLFLSQSAETIRGGTLLSIISFGYRKKLGFRGLCHQFPSKIFCLTVPKHFVEEPFSVVFQKISCGEKVYG